MYAQYMISRHDLTACGIVDWFHLRLNLSALGFSEVQNYE